MNDHLPGREIMALVEAALSTTEGQMPAHIHQKIGIGSLSTVRGCLLALCKAGRVRREGHGNRRLYFRVSSGEL
jgi:hypothetical protein